jgi:hypothetical protein
LGGTTTNAVANTNSNLGTFSNTYKNTDAATEQNADADSYLGTFSHAYQDPYCRAD